MTLEESLNLRRKTRLVETWALVSATVEMDRGSPSEDHAVLTMATTSSTARDVGAVTTIENQSGQRFEAGRTPMGAMSRYPAA